MHFLPPIFPIRAMNPCCCPKISHSENQQQASQSLDEGPPSNAVDGNKDTSWQSGSEAPQWIEIDLGDVFSIEEIRLYVDQAPAGNTVHRVSGKENEGDDFTEMYLFSGHTDFGDVLEHKFGTPAENIRYIRIETTGSPSWISWSEIEVYGRK